MAFAKNTRTGKFVSVPDHYIGHPVFGGDLILVDEESADKLTKEKKTKITAAPVAEPIQEQEAPKTNIEDEEYEDGN